MNEHTTAAEVVQLFGLINDSLRAEGLRKVVYKPTPWIYHRQPSEEDLYALIEVCHPRLSRSLSSAISRETLNPWYRIRLNGARRASEAGVVIEETDDYLPFWQILEHNLRSRYGLAPVHSVDEIMLLHNRLPDHIRLFVAKYQGETLGGTVLFVTPRVVHSQYIAASEQGKQLHVLDLLFQTVIRESLVTHPYFDFGISTEKHGTWLNEALIYQKEGFGGRGVCYDWYEYDL